MSSGGPFSALSNYLKAHEKVHIAWCVSGIVGCLLLYGVLQVRTVRQLGARELSMLSRMLLLYSSDERSRVEL